MSRKACSCSATRAPPTPRRPNWKARRGASRKWTSKPRKRNPFPPFMTSTLQRASLHQPPPWHRPDHAHCAAALRRRRGGQRRFGGSHHLHAYRLAHRLARRTGRGARLHQRDVRGGVRAGVAKPLPLTRDSAGRARGDPPHVGSGARRRAWRRIWTASNSRSTR